MAQWVTLYTLVSPTLVTCGSNLPVRRPLSQILPSPLMMQGTSLKPERVLQFFFFFFFFFLLCCPLSPVAAHPQCLDSGPPSRPPSLLTLCGQFSALGCCRSAEDEGKVLEVYEQLRHDLKEQDWDRCRHHVQGLLCQRCSPLAAHIFDAELPTSSDAPPRLLPGLCADYCRLFYDECREVVWLLDPALAASEDFSHRNAFCNRTVISDMGYCYPDYALGQSQYDGGKEKEEEKASEEGEKRVSAASEEGCVCLRRVAGGLANPVIARHAGDGSGRLFVGEQRGVVHVLYPDSQRQLDVPFIDVSGKVLLSDYFGDERGVNGLAFHPNFSSNGRVFLYHNVPLTEAEQIALAGKWGLSRWSHKSRLSEMRVLPAQPDTVDSSFEKVLLEVDQPYPNHNGGEMFFLDDGYLYLILGDGGAAGDPHNSAQNKSRLLGKVLRLDVDVNEDVAASDGAYGIPPDNPFVHEAGARPEVFAFGVRNIWRCGVDPGDPHTGWGRDRVLCGDVGQALYEEIDLLKKGANYGWRAREGFQCYDKGMCGKIGEEELPVWAYNHTVGQSVTGGHFYRGCRSPALRGKYLYGDYMSKSRRLFSLEETSSGTWRNSDVTLCGDDVCTGDLTNVVDPYILSFGQDQQGEVYMLTSTDSIPISENGSVYIIVDPVSDKTGGDC